MVTLPISLVVLDRRVEYVKLIAARSTDRVKPFQACYGIGKIVDLKICLSQILVGATMIRIDVQRPLVVDDRVLEIAELAVTVAQVVESASVLGIFGQHVCKIPDGITILLILYCADGFVIVRIARRRLLVLLGGV